MQRLHGALDRLTFKFTFWLPAPIVASLNIPAKYLRPIQAALLVAAAFYVYAPSLNGGWLWDDFEIRENLQLRSWSGLLRMWYAPATPDYAPLRTLVYWIEWHLWGDGLFGFHLTSIALHICAAWVLWRVLDRLIAIARGACIPARRWGWESAFSAGWIAAMLFIVHPVAVESVAWVSEIKNTLSLALLLGAMLAYIRFDGIFTGRSGSSWRIPSNPFSQEGRKDREEYTEPRHFLQEDRGERHSGGLPIPDPATEAKAVLPGLPDLPVKKNNSAPAPSRSSCKNWYLVSLLLFVSAVLVKASVVMFPLGLLLYAWWRRGRVRWADLLASLPFFVVSLALGEVTILFQMSRAIAHWNLPKFSLAARIAQAGLAIVFYFGKCLIPADTMPIYPAWRLQPLSVWDFWPWGVIGLVVCSLAVLRRGTQSGGANGPPSAQGAASVRSHESVRSTSRHVAFGLGWFVLFLLPVIGFIPMAYQHVAPVADHLCYLSLAVFVCLAAVGICALAGSAATPARASREQGGTRQDGASTAGSARAAFVFGLACVLVLILAHASRRYAKVFANQETLWTYNLAHNSTSPAVYVNLGFIEHHDGDNAAAIANYKKAIQLDPDDAQAEDELASVYIDQHDTRNALAHYRQAIAHYERALKLDPSLIATRRSLGKALAESGQTEQAIAQYQRILRENPKDAQTETNYGKALGDEGRYAEAMAHFEKALQIDPDSAEAENSLGMAYMAEGHPEQAKRHVEQAIRLNGDFAEAENNLGFILASQGLQGAAIPCFKEALRLKPSFGLAENNLGFALAGVNRMPEAIAHLQRAVDLAPADPKAHYNLAMVLAATGRRAPAIAELKATLALDPNFARAKELLGRLRGTERK